MNPTANQLKAINQEGQDILISAGAGSGKTSVLTSRVMRKMEEGKKLSRLLMLTFTKAAANNMRSKLDKKCHEALLGAEINDEAKSNLRREMDYLSSASIMTFDAFNQGLVKKYFYLLGISPSFQNTPTPVLNQALDQIIDGVFDRYYQTQNKDFLSFLDSFTLKGDYEIRSLIKKAIAAESKRPDPHSDFLDLEAGFKDGGKKGLSKIDAAYAYFTAGLKKELVSLREAFRLQCEDDDEAYGQEKIKVMKLLEGLENLDSMSEILEIYDQLKIRRKKGKTSPFEEILDQRKKAFGSWRTLCLSLPEKKKAQEVFTSNLGYQSVLVAIADEVYTSFQAFKEEKGAYDFDDIGHMALKLLREKKEALDQVASSFDEIMVDEYQDNSDMQEEFLSLITSSPCFKGHLFLVGDVKQSIYAFRNSDPKYFKARFDSYSKGDKGLLISMNDNFRSAPGVIDFVNTVFSALMKEDFGGADYKSGHALKSSNPLLQDIGLKTTSLDYHLQGKLGEAPSAKKEAYIIGNDILKRIHDGEMIGDKKSLHRASFKDFTIIMDRGTQFDIYAKVFKDLHIPLIIDKNRSEKDSLIINTVKNLLIMYNGVSCSLYEDGDFLHAFLSLLRGPLGQYKDAEIHKIFLTREFKGVKLFQDMEKAVKEDQGKDICGIYDDLVARFDVLKAISYTSDPSLSYQFLSSYHSTLEAMAYLGFDAKKASDYFAYLENNDDSSGEIVLSAPFSNAVTLTNIHKSKGLEYNVIYLAGISKRLTGKQDTSHFGFDLGYGMELPYLARQFAMEKTADPGLKMPQEPLRQFRNEQEKKKNQEEKLRLFYVALTRAKYQIVLVQRKDKEKEADDTSEANTFQGFLALSKSQLGYDPIRVKREVDPMDMDKKPDSESEGRTLRTALPFAYKPLGTINYGDTKKTASKGDKTHEGEKALAFGTRLHLALQAVSFKTQDFSFIQEEEIRKLVKGFFDSDLFKMYGSYKAYKEYHYLDLKTGDMGSIDLLWEGKDEIVIVDYKLKNIADEDYVSQLKAYKENAEFIFKKKASSYLFSLLGDYEAKVC